MKSNYLICEDFDVGDFAYVDEEYRKKSEEPVKVEIIYINQISAIVKNSKGAIWIIMRNRLARNTKYETNF